MLKGKLLVFTEDGMREISLEQRAYEIVQDCLEAGIDAYEEDEDQLSANILRSIVDAMSKED